MTIREFLLCATESKPLSEAAAQRILLRVLEIIRRGSPEELTEPPEEY